MTETSPYHINGSHQVCQDIDCREFMNFNAFLLLIESNEAKCTIYLTSFSFDNTTNEEKGQEKTFYTQIRMHLPIF